MNAVSSRSHSIFQVIVEKCTDRSAEGLKDNITSGKLCLVELAGSER